MNNQFKPLRFDELSYNCVSDVHTAFPIFYQSTVIHQSEHYFNSLNEYLRYIVELTTNCCCYVVHQIDCKECFLIRNYVPIEKSNLIHTYFIRVFYKPSLKSKKFKNV